MSDNNKKLVRRLTEEVFNQGNLNVVDELVTTNFVHHEPFGGDSRGAQGYKELTTMYRNAFPDAKITIDEQIAEGDLVATRWTATGTHRGALMGINPTGKRVTVTGITVARVQNGKIVEEFENFDAFGMLRQLGVVSGGLGKAA